MGQAIELLAGFATAPGAAITALTMGVGCTNVVRSVAEDKNPLLIAMWAINQAAGIVRVMSPRMCNNNQGIHYNSVVANGCNLVPHLPIQKLYSQDTLTLGISGSAGAGDMEQAGFIIYYPDLPGCNGNFITIDDLNKRGVNIMTNRNVIAVGAGGGFTGQAALNATENMFKANVDYAIMGYTVSAQCGAVRMIASDLGNIGIGGPGDVANRNATAEWFIKMTRDTGLPCIPVINSANVGGIVVDAEQDENAAAVAICWNFVELGS